MKEAPKTHGLHLASDETVADAWALFWERVAEYADIVQKRQSEKQADGTNEQRNIQKQRA